MMETMNEYKNPCILRLYAQQFFLSDSPAMIAMEVLKLFSYSQKGRIAFILIEELSRSNLPYGGVP